MGIWLRHFTGQAVLDLSSKGGLSRILCNRSSVGKVRINHQLKEKSPRFILYTTFEKEIYPLTQININNDSESPG
jgi:hypothetical protein